MRALDAYHWPGNVRELQNRVKRAVIMAEGARIRTEDLDLPTEVEEAGDLDLRSCRERVERMVLRRALVARGGNLSQAARLIGVSRPPCTIFCASTGCAVAPKAAPDDRGTRPGAPTPCA